MYKRERAKRRARDRGKLTKIELAAAAVVVGAPSGQAKKMRKKQENREEMRRKQEMERKQQTTEGQHRPNANIQTPRINIASNEEGIILGGNYKEIITRLSNIFKKLRENGMKENNFGITENDLVKDIEKSLREVEGDFSSPKELNETHFTRDESEEANLPNWTVDLKETLSSVIRTSHLRLITVLVSRISTLRPNSMKVVNETADNEFLELLSDIFIFKSTKMKEEQMQSNFDEFINDKVDAYDQHHQLRMKKETFSDIKKVVSEFDQMIFGYNVLYRKRKRTTVVGASDGEILNQINEGRAWSFVRYIMSGTIGSNFGRNPFSDDKETAPPFLVNGTAPKDWLKIEFAISRDQFQTMYQISGNTKPEDYTFLGTISLLGKLPESERHEMSIEGLCTVTIRDLSDEFGLLNESRFFLSSFFIKHPRRDKILQNARNVYRRIIETKNTSGHIGSMRAILQLAHQSNYLELDFMLDRGWFQHMNGNTIGDDEHAMHPWIGRQLVNIKDALEGGGEEAQMYKRRLQWIEYFNPDTKQTRKPNESLFLVSCPSTMNNNKNLRFSEEKVFNFMNCIMSNFKKKTDDEKKTTLLLNVVRMARKNPEEQQLLLLIFFIHYLRENTSTTESDKVWMRSTWERILLPTTSERTKTTSVKEEGDVLTIDHLITVFKGDDVNKMYARCEGLKNNNFANDTCNEIQNEILIRKILESDSPLSLPSELEYVQKVINVANREQLGVFINLMKDKNSKQLGVFIYLIKDKNKEQLGDFLEVMKEKHMDSKQLGDFLEEMKEKHMDSKNSCEI